MQQQAKQRLLKFDEVKMLENYRSMLYVQVCLCRLSLYENGQDLDIHDSNYTNSNLLKSKVHECLLLLFSIQRHICI